MKRSLVIGIPVVGGLAAALAMGIATAQQKEEPRRPSEPAGAPGGAGAPKRGEMGRMREMGGMSLEAMLKDWPEASRKAAQQVQGKYGRPHEMTPSMLIWNQTGSWKKTIVYKEEIRHDWPRPHTDVLEQWVDYRVPPDKFDDVARFDGSVIAERTKGVLSARCDNEEMNHLAVNLAAEVAKGTRTSEDARGFYVKTAAAAMRGETSPYTQALRIEKAAPGTTADPDRPSAEMKAALEGAPGEREPAPVQGRPAPGRRRPTP
jgi:hypothetical protein